jgi:TolA-binding protein
MDDQLTLYCVIDINHDGRFYKAGSPFSLVAGPDVDRLREQGFLKLASEISLPPTREEQQHADLVAAHKQIGDLEAKIVRLEGHITYLESQKTIDSFLTEEDENETLSPTEEG